jgi:hypothetical protein
MMVRSAAVVAAFAIGLGVGLSASLSGFLTAAPGVPADSYPALPPVAEPPSAAAVADAVRRDDARTLSGLLDSDALQTLTDALAPIVEVTDVRFGGAAQAGNDDLVGYVVYGRDRSGQHWVTGFVVVVQGDRVIRIE